MIATTHLLCVWGGGGRCMGGGFYIMIIQLHALLGLGASSPKKIFKKLCHLVRFCLYLDQILS